MTKFVFAILFTTMLLTGCNSMNVRPTVGVSVGTAL
ncbi:MULTISPECIES: colicin release lysis protein [unclassified Acinetobacter]|nr:MULTISPECIES: colicin release lysis protein [unclassified Acinetobacter]